MSQQKNRRPFSEEVLALIKPISKDSKCGSWIRSAPEYLSILTDKEEDDSTLPMGEWERPLKKANWKKVIYRYDDPWALFDMMNAHGTGSEKSSIGQILKFEFPVRLKEGSTENENIDLNARIFLELRLRSSHDNKRLKFRGTTRIEPPLL